MQKTSIQVQGFYVDQIFSFKGTDGFFKSFPSIFRMSTVTQSLIGPFGGFSKAKSRLSSLLTELVVEVRESQNLYVALQHFFFFSWGKSCCTCYKSFHWCQSFFFSFFLFTELFFSFYFTMVCFVIACKTLTCERRFFFVLVGFGLFFLYSSFVFSLSFEAFEVFFSLVFFFFLHFVELQNLYPVSVHLIWEFVVFFELLNVINPSHHFFWQFFLIWPA